MVKLLVQITPAATATIYKGHWNRTKEILWQVADRNREKFTNVEEAKAFLATIITNNALEYKLELFGGGVNFGHTKNGGEFVAYGNISYIPVL